VAARSDLAALVAPVERAAFATTPLTPEAPAPGTARRTTEEPTELAPQVARVRAIAVTKTAPSRRLQAGDLICGMCGEGNPSTRRFCSRCGSSLIEAERVRESWWRRLLRKLMPRRGPKVVALGKVKYRQKDGTSNAQQLAKPGFDLKHAFRRTLRMARIVISVTVLVGGLLFAVYPPFRHTVDNRFDSLKRRFSNDIDANLSPIHAVKVTATSTSDGSSPLNAADELLNTYWLAPWSTSAQPTLTFTFSRHVTLKKMILHSGATNTFVQFSRPSQLILKFSNGESATILPQDTPQQQTFTIGHADFITSMQIQVAGIDQGSDGSDVAITEIELFGYNT
jgi:hypothetical protein